MVRPQAHHDRPLSVILSKAGTVPRTPGFDGFLSGVEGQPPGNIRCLSTPKRCLSSVEGRNCTTNPRLRRAQPPGKPVPERSRRTATGEIFDACRRTHLTVVRPAHHGGLTGSQDRWSPSKWFQPWACIGSWLPLLVRSNTWPASAVMNPIKLILGFFFSFS